MHFIYSKITRMTSNYLNKNKVNFQKNNQLKSKTSPLHFLSVFQHIPLSLQERLVLISICFLLTIDFSLISVDCVHSIYSMPFIYYLKFTRCLSKLAVSSEMSCSVG